MQGIINELQIDESIIIY